MGMYNENRPKFVSIVKGMFRTGAEHDQVETNRISGRIIGLHLLDDEYEGKKYKKIQVDLCDYEPDGLQQIYWLQFPLASGYGISFCMMLPLIRFAIPVVFSAKTEKREDGKDKTTLFASQAGNSVKWYYTKDNPRDLPPLVKTGSGWDSTDQQRYFMNEIERVGENLKKSYDGVAAPNEIHKDVQVDPPELLAPIDDLPF